MLVNCIISHDQHRLSGLLHQLDQENSLTLHNLIDENGFTLLCRSCSENSLKSTELLYEFVQLRITRHLRQQEHMRLNVAPSGSLTQESLRSIDLEVSQQMKEWVNKPCLNGDQFYPIHYASFHGNPKLIKFLIRAGANPFVKTLKAVNCLHIAAQGDSAYSLCYFRSRGISINSVDAAGSTPLHWACFSASDTATYYLQSWDC